MRTTRAIPHFRTSGEFSNFTNLSSEVALVLFWEIDIILESVMSSTYQIVILILKAQNRLNVLIIGSNVGFEDGLKNALKQAQTSNYQNMGYISARKMQKQK